MPSRSAVDQLATTAWVQALSALQDLRNPSRSGTYPAPALRVARQATDAYCGVNGLRHGSARTDSRLQMLVRQSPGDPRQGLMACAHWLSERGVLHAVNQGVRQLRAELRAYAVSDAQETVGMLGQLLFERPEPALLMAAKGIAALHASLEEPDVLVSASGVWTALQDVRNDPGSSELADLLMERVDWNLDLFAAQAWALVHGDRGAEVMGSMPKLRQLCKAGVAVSPQLVPLVAWQPDEARINLFAAWDAAGLTSTCPWLAALAHLEGPAESCAWENQGNTTQWTPGGQEPSLRAFLATRTLGATAATTGELKTSRGGKLLVEVGIGETCGQAVTLLSQAIVDKVGALSGARQMLLLNLCNLALPLSHHKIVTLADVADFKDNSEALLKSVFDITTLGTAQALMADALNEEAEQLRNDVARLARTHENRDTQAACRSLQEQLAAMTPLSGDLLATASKALRACARSIEGGRGVEMSFDLSGLPAAHKQAYGLTQSQSLALRVVFSCSSEAPSFALADDQGILAGSVTAGPHNRRKLFKALRWIGVSKSKGKGKAPVGSDLSSLPTGNPVSSRATFQLTGMVAGNPVNSRAVFQLTRLIAGNLQQSGAARSDPRVVQDLYDLVIARLPKLADNCLVCDAPQQTGLVRPTTCASDTCAEELQTNGTDTLLQDLRDEPEMTEFLRRVAHDSVSSSKHLAGRLLAGRLEAPFATQYLQPLPSLGPTSDLRQMLGADTNMWVELLSRFRAHIVKIPPASQWPNAQTPHQYEVWSMPPEVEGAFTKPSGSKLRYLFHASPAGNWYSILHQGIRSSPGAFGAGVYLADPAVPGYMAAASGSMDGSGIIAACAVNLMPEENVYVGGYCVRDQTRVLPRFLFVYDHVVWPLDVTENGLRQWMGQKI